LCADEPFYDQPISAFCTGFLVGPDLVVTAGHCIRNEYGCEKSRIVFNFAYYNNSDTPTIVEKDDVFECKEVIHTETDALSGSDFAIIRLKQQVSQYSPLTLQLNDKIADDQSLTVIGHPSGLPAKWANEANVRTNDEDFFFVANLDTYGGNSGSPVFNSETKAVEGILVRGEADYKYDVEEKCRRSNNCEIDECRGQDVVRISSILDYVDVSELEPLPPSPNPTLLTPPIGF
ncbi:MAG: trypsin-like peptidase domain-containing protein, partial [Bdellovibrionales bacterium]|nr:serine protease [Bdellovibrionales bacterium]NQZ20346.1 trypsin-like peptidase domain-containing protein [Bdellovibrionales bacterium]